MELASSFEIGAYAVKILLAWGRRHGIVGWRGGGDGYGWFLKRVKEAACGVMQKGVGMAKENAEQCFGCQGECRKGPRLAINILCLRRGTPILARQERGSRPLTRICFLARSGTAVRAVLSRLASAHRLSTCSSSRCGSARHWKDEGKPQDGYDLSFSRRRRNEGGWGWVCIQTLSGGASDSHRCKGKVRGLAQGLITF